MCPLFLRGDNTLIKECKVKTKNDKVAVILFDGKEIQVPSSKLIQDSAYVKLNKGKYIVVSDDEFYKEKATTEASSIHSKRKKIDNIVMDNEE